MRAEGGWATARWTGGVTGIPGRHRTEANLRAPLLGSRRRPPPRLPPAPPRPARPNPACPHRFISPPAPGRSELKAKDLRDRYISCSCCSSLQLEFSTARLTLEE